MSQGNTSDSEIEICRGIKNNESQKLHRFEHSENFSLLSLLIVFNSQNKVNPEKWFSDAH